MGVPPSVVCPRSLVRQRDHAQPPRRMDDPNMTERISRFLAENRPETPCLVVDLDVIAEAYDLLRWYLPLARIYYAVKANPAPQIVAMLERKGASFDVASRGEIELCLNNGVAAERLSFGNTIRRKKTLPSPIRRGSGCSLSTVRPNSTSWRERRRARAYSAAFWSPVMAPSGRCRANSVAPPRWQSSCCAEPAISASTPMASPFMSAPSKPISDNGTARLGALRGCFHCSPRRISSCVW